MAPSMLLTNKFMKQPMGEELPKLGAKECSFIQYSIPLSTLKQDWHCGACLATGGGGDITSH